MIATPRAYARLRTRVLAVSLVAWLVLLRLTLPPAAYGAGTIRTMSYCAAGPEALAWSTTGGAGAAGEFLLRIAAQAPSLLGAGP